MINITKEKVFAILNEGGTHRKQFSHSSGVQKSKARPTFSVPFDQGLCQHFLDGTSKRLTYNSGYQQHYCFLRSLEDIEQVEAWEAAQGTRVFLRNALSSSLALDCNFQDNTSGTKTSAGANEEAAKHDQDEAAIGHLAAWSADTIRDISYLRDADFICAIPAMPMKGFDLPTRLAQDISQLVGKRDLTPSFNLANKTKSLKACSLDEKWDIWMEAQIDYSGPELQGASVILIDDKYQSGITQQYFGMILQQQGCGEIHGLCMVKTLRDTDNVSLIDG